MAEWIKNRIAKTHGLLNTHLNFKDTYKMKGQKQVFQGNDNQKKVGIVLLVSDKIAFKLKMVTRTKVII